MAGCGCQNVSRFGWRQALCGAIKSFASYFLVIMTTGLNLITSSASQHPLVGLALVAGLYTASSFLMGGDVALAILLAYTWQLHEESAPLRLTCRQLLARSSADACTATDTLCKFSGSAITGVANCGGSNLGLIRACLEQLPSPPTAAVEQMSHSDSTCGVWSEHSNRSQTVTPEADCASCCSSVSKEAKTLQDAPAAAAEDLALLPAINLACKVQPTAPPPAESPMTEAASPKGPSTPTRLSETSCGAAPVKPASSKATLNMLPTATGTMPEVHHLFQEVKHQELDQAGTRVADSSSKPVEPAPGNGGDNGGATVEAKAASGLAEQEMMAKHLGKSAKVANSLAQLRQQLVQAMADIHGLKVECLDDVAGFIEQVDELLTDVEYDGKVLLNFGSWQHVRYGLIRNVAAVRSHIQCLTKCSKAWVAPSYRATSGQLTGLGTSLKKHFDAVESAVTAISSNVTMLMCCSSEANLLWNDVYTQQLTNAAKLATLNLAVCQIRERCSKVCGRV